MPASSASILLLNNLICGNRLGELGGPLLDRADAGNLTPAGTEGPGVRRAPGCGEAGVTYRDLPGADERAGTPDDDFTPAAGSALLDRGLDARDLGLGAIPAALLEGDLLAPAARPRPGTLTGPAAFDIGAIEGAVEADTVAPAVDFLVPHAGALVRGVVAIEAEATDPGSGVQNLTLQADRQPISASSTPAPPAPAVTARGRWTTSGTPDGAHTLTAIAMDGAGATGSATRLVITDNTPPVVLIESGPETVSGSEATFVLAATDNLTPPDELRIAWRLDGSPWSPFEVRPTVVLTDLIPGAHVLEAKALDGAGNESPTPARRSFTVDSVRVAITHPQAGAVVESGLLVVRGTVTSGAREVGLLVNGYPALVESGAFAALTEIRPSTTEVSAVATSVTGATGSATARITVVDVGPLVLLLDASPQIGVAPLAVSFDLSGDIPGAPIELDLEGDGRVEITTVSLNDQSFSYDRPGIYAPTVAQTDADGTRRSASAVVLVVDRGAFDALLQAKWAGMKTALRAGDIPRALTYISPGARDRYGEVFQAISGQLSTIDTLLTDITLDYVGNGYAIYQAARTDATVPMLFEVRFAMGFDGLWRIDSF